MAQALPLEDAAKSIARILNLSPAGTDLWARQSVERAGETEYDALTGIEAEIGRELQKDAPDRARLDALVARYGAESAAIDERRKGREIADMFEHTPEDRQKIGRFIERSAQRSLQKTRPVLQVLP